MVNGSYEEWQYTRNGGVATLRASRPEIDAAMNNPHFTYHAVVQLGGTYFDPSYGDWYLPSEARIDETVSKCRSSDRYKNGVSAMKYVLGATFTILVGIGSAFAQGEGPLHENLKAVMQKAFPNARVEPTPLAPRPYREYEQLQWRYSDEGTVRIRFFVRETVADAKKLLSSRVRGSAIGANQIDGFGDEAYLVAAYSPLGIQRLHFRRGNVVAEVVVTGAEDVRRFAALFVAEVGKLIAENKRIGR